MIIIISGPPGVGTTTIALAVKKYFNLKFFSTGDVFREISKQRGLELPILNEIAEQAVDLEVDNKCRSEALANNVVIESDIAAYLNTDLKPIKIYLDAPLDIRAQRIFNDPKKRVAEKKYSTVEEVKEEIEKRREFDKVRYMKHYGIDIEDKSIFDLVIDTSNLTEKEVIDKVINFVKEKLELK